MYLERRRISIICTATYIQRREREKDKKRKRSRSKRATIDTNDFWGGKEARTFFSVVHMILLVKRNPDIHMVMCVGK